MYLFQFTFNYNNNNNTITYIAPKSSETKLRGASIQNDCCDKHYGYQTDRLLRQVAMVDKQGYRRTFLNNDGIWQYFQLI